MFSLFCSRSLHLQQQVALTRYYMPCDVVCVLLVIWHSLLVYSPSVTSVHVTACETKGLPQDAYDVWPITSGDITLAWQNVADPAMWLTVSVSGLCIVGAPATSTSTTMHLNDLMQVRM